MNKKRIFFQILLLSISLISTKAEIKNQTVYKIHNNYYPDRCLSISSSGAVTTIDNPEDLKQLWWLEEDEFQEGFTFRNMFSGAYLASPKQLYSQWNLEYAEVPDTQSMLMTVEEYDDHYSFRATDDRGNSYGFGHNDAANNLVCWTRESQPTLWDFEEIILPEDEIESILQRIRELSDVVINLTQYEDCLAGIFTDAACTILKENTDPEENPDFEGLPQSLQEMAIKIKSDNWHETLGDWDNEHAKKYRVQLYEPYSEGSAAAGFAGILPYTNMNNPTGIIADEGEMLYVMVDEDIPEGATLYIDNVSDNGMHNSTTSGTKLHKGLNIILCNENNSHYFIYYSVNTVKDGQPSEYKLSDFQPLKIHIEGGRLNGFFNYVGDELYTPDTLEDYEYTSERAIHPMYDLIGKYVILHFFLNDTPNTPEEETLQFGVRSSLDPEINPGDGREYDPVRIMQAWDNMCLTERMVMGLQGEDEFSNPFHQGKYSTIVGKNYSVGDYSADPGFYFSDYFNNRMMGITLQAKGLYMNATNWRTAFAPGTVATILTRFYHDGLWGPAHEYGHINQGPMRFAGTTEISNNLFSNVALYYSENSTTSRTDFISSQLKNFNEGKTYLENGTFGTTRMFWQLWCYYHATKHNTRFYPRLYELLRKNPLKRDPNPQEGILNPRYDMLHFAKMCCIAAGEDLTDFFEAWGFFVPLDMYHISDYDEYDCLLTKEDIQAVKNEIAEFGFPKNYSIILIDDRPGSERPSEGGYPKERAGDLGGLKDFEKGAIPSGDFSFAIEDNKITIDSAEAVDGVGFLIYDKDDKLIGFSNSHEFELSEDAMVALTEATAQIYAVGTDNSLYPLIKEPEPDQPEEPGEIEEPDQPENPDQPEEPQEPENPEEPVQPEEPDDAGVDFNWEPGIQFDVYTLNGILLRKNIENNELTTLSPGLYILRNNNFTEIIKIK